MSDASPNAEERWDHVRALMETETLSFSAATADLFRRDPLRLLARLNDYKFAAKLIGPGRSVLDLSCEEGLGTWLLAKECGAALGLGAEDPDLLRERWGEGAEFSAAASPPRPYQALVCLEPAAWDLSRCAELLAARGLLVLRLPAEAPAAEAAAAELEAGFDHVFLFSAPAQPLPRGARVPGGALALACGRGGRS